jgi:hypothetical protein
MLKDVPGDDDSVNLALDTDLLDRGQHHRMLVIPGEAGKRLSDMPIGRVKYSHAPHVLPTGAHSQCI